MVHFNGNWLNWDTNGDNVTGKATSIQIKSNGKKYVTLEDVTVKPPVEGVPDVVYLNVNPMQEQQVSVGERFSFTVFNEKLWFNVEPAVHRDWDVHEEAFEEVMTPVESVELDQQIHREPVYPSSRALNHMDEEELQAMIDYFTERCDEAHRDAERYGRLLRLLEAL